jgi:hypothetical protein
MRRVLAVLLIATLTTMMAGIDATSWASQERDQNQQEKQRAAVTKALREMHRGTTATIERLDGERVDVVIEEITPDAITVLHQQRDRVVTETIPIADIAKINRARDGPDIEGVDWVAVALGVLVVPGAGGLRIGGFKSNWVPARRRLPTLQ